LLGNACFVDRNACQSVQTVKEKALSQEQTFSLRPKDKADG
jgi:hypothetical protein